MQFKLDLRQFSKKLDALARRQLPFAAAQALNAVGQKAIEAERAAMRSDLDRPRSFTTDQGLRLKAARKSDLTAIVFIPPIQSRYLAPEIDGGVQALGKSGEARAILRPIRQATDQYGNLPRNLLNRLKGRSDIFIGTVKFNRSGESISGVWQRPKVGKRRTGDRGTKGKIRSVGDVQTGLKLLVRFSDPVTVKTRYPFGTATMATAKAMFPGELRRQLALALRIPR